MLKSSPFYQKQVHGAPDCMWITLTLISQKSNVIHNSHGNSQQHLQKAFLFRRVTNSILVRWLWSRRPIFVVSFCLRQLYQFNTDKTCSFTETWKQPSIQFQKKIVVADLRNSSNWILQHGTKRACINIVIAREEPAYSCSRSEAKSDMWHVPARPLFCNTTTATSTP